MITNIEYFWLWGLYSLATGLCIIASISKLYYSARWNINEENKVVGLEIKKINNGKKILFWTNLILTLIIVPCGIGLFSNFPSETATKIVQFTIPDILIILTSLFAFSGIFKFIDSFRLVSVRSREFIVGVLNNKALNINRRLIISTFWTIISVSLIIYRLSNPELNCIIFKGFLGYHLFIILAITILLTTFYFLIRKEKGLTLDLNKSKDSNTSNLKQDDETLYLTFSLILAFFILALLYYFKNSTNFNTIASLINQIRVEKNNSLLIEAIKENFANDTFIVKNNIGIANYPKRSFAEFLIFLNNYSNLDTIKIIEPLATNTNCKFTELNIQQDIKVELSYYFNELAQSKDNPIPYKILSTLFSKKCPILRITKDSVKVNEVDALNYISRLQQDVFRYEIKIDHIEIKNGVIDSIKILTNEY